MLALLAANWGLLLFRGSIAVLFGITLLWPGLTLAALAFLFGAYTLVDGIVTLIVAFETRGLLGFGNLFEELVRLSAALIAFAYPGITETRLLALITVWAVLSGLGEITAAIVLRKELTGEWPLPLAGALSVAFGVALLLRPGAGALALAWLIGLYAIVFGVTLVALALRLRQLAQEIPGAAAPTSRTNSPLSSGTSTRSSSGG
jgi:uncharacterized membrane protein HdeD (DUF308 family)